MHSDFNSFPFPVDFPESNVLFIRKFLHTPRGFKACSEVHRDEQSDFEPLDELSATKGIAVADTPIYWEHHYIETIGDLADVLQFAKELLLVSYRIERLFHLKAVSLLIRIVVRQELGIPVVQVARMKDTFTFGLNNPRHAAVCAA